MSRLYGLIGLLSLLGIVGLYTEEKYLLFFFFAVVDFKFLFKKPDEMQIEQLKKAGALACYCAMVAFPISMVISLFLFRFEFLNAWILSNAILIGILFGVQSIAMIYFSYAESRGARFVKD